MIVVREKKNMTRWLFCGKLLRDGQLDKYEEYYIRKIKDLLYLSHDFIKAVLAKL